MATARGSAVRALLSRIARWHARTVPSPRPSLCQGDSCGRRRRPPDRRARAAAIADAGDSREASVARRDRPRARPRSRRHSDQHDRRRTCDDARGEAPQRRRGMGGSLRVKRRCWRSWCAAMRTKRSPRRSVVSKAPSRFTSHTSCAGPASRRARSSSRGSGSQTVRPRPTSRPRVSPYMQEPRH